MNTAELKALPAVIDVPTAACALGLGRAVADAGVPGREADPHPDSTAARHPWGQG